MPRQLASPRRLSRALFRRSSPNSLRSVRDPSRSPRPKPVAAPQACLRHPVHSLTGGSTERAARARPRSKRRRRARSADRAARPLRGARNPSLAHEAGRAAHLVTCGSRVNVVFACWQLSPRTTWRPSVTDFLAIARMYAPPFAGSLLKAAAGSSQPSRLPRTPLGLHPRPRSSRGTCIHFLACLGKRRGVLLLIHRGPGRKAYSFVVRAQEETGELRS